MVSSDVAAVPGKTRPATATAAAAGAVNHPKDANTGGGNSCNIRNTTVLLQAPLVVAVAVLQM